MKTRMYMASLVCQFRPVSLLERPFSLRVVSGCDKTTCLEDTI